MTRRTFQRMHSTRRRVLAELRATRGPLTAWQVVNRLGRATTHQGAVDMALRTLAALGRVRPVEVSLVLGIKGASVPVRAWEACT